MTLKNLAIMYVHGIHVVDHDYAHALHLNIMDLLCANHPEHRIVDVYDRIFYRAAFWADIFAPAQVALDTSLASYDLSWLKLRQFMAASVAQAVGYEGARTDPSYEGVHARLSVALADLSNVAGPETDLVIVAHSLGCVVTSDFIWDMQHTCADHAPDTALERLETLRGLVTMGNPSALYASRYTDMGVPIRAGSGGVMWQNLMASADVIAWPLRTLNPAYALEVHEDKVVNVGMLNNLTPAAHTAYWDALPVAREIADLVSAVWKED